MSKSSVCQWATMTLSKSLCYLQAVHPNTKVPGLAWSNYEYISRFEETFGGYELATRLLSEIHNFSCTLRSCETLYIFRILCKECGHYEDVLCLDAERLLKSTQHFYCDGCEERIALPLDYNPVVTTLRIEEGVL